MYAAENNKALIRSRENWPNWLMKLFDSGALMLGLYYLTVLVPQSNSKSTLLVGLVGLTAFNFLGEFLGLFRRWQGIAFEREVACATATWIFTFMMIGTLGQFAQVATEMVGTSLLVWFLASLVFSLSARMFLRWIYRWRTDHGIHTRNYAVVGINGLGIQLARNIDATPDLGLKLMGFYDDRPDERTETLPDDFSKKLGSLTDLIDSAKQRQVQVIFITLPMRAEERIRSLIQQLADSTVSVYIVPDLFVFQMLHSRWSDVQGIPIVSVFENPLYGVDGALKRGLDVALALIGLVILAIPMALIAVAVKLTSKGPVFFRQLRYGLDGKPIRVWKFRSMTVMENGSQVQQAQRNDGRLTPLGGVLRRTSLDELPQLFNVLTGSMSLVGPRPHANAHNEYYRNQIQGYMLRHKVKPGITGLAQVNGCRGETETLDKMESRIKFDHQYIREWTIWLDLRIIFQTFRVIASKQNAY
jgi:putative colanic acid biosysnthesis UDP-glucose lipid carrier transferase